MGQNGLIWLRPTTARSWLLTTRIGSTSAQPPWRDTCTSGPPWECPPSRRFTVSAAITDPALHTGLLALEGLKLAEKDPNGGRRLTSQGRRDLDRIAAQIKLAAAEKAKKAAAADAVIAIA